MSNDFKHLQGASTELFVASHLLREGKPVYFPAMGQGRCDLIYLTPNPVRVQVKTATWSKSGVWKYEQCRLSRDNRSSHYHKFYTSEEVDEVWVLGTHLWVFPVEFVSNRTSLFLMTDNPNPSPASKRRNYNPDDFIRIRGSLDSPIRP